MGTPSSLESAIHATVCWFSLSGLPLSAALVRLEEKAGVATLQVTDHGPGIPEAELGRIFEPFYRLGNDGAKGFGLGLAIAQLAVQAHGGTIRAANTGSGLELTLQLKT